MLRRGENGIDYAHKNMEIFLREAFDFVSSYRNNLRDMAVDVVGYPHSDLDGDERYFDIITLILLDRSKTKLQPDSPFVGYRVDVEYWLNDTKKGHGRFEGPNSAVITANRQPTEFDLMVELGTRGKPVYRLNLIKTSTDN